MILKEKNNDIALRSLSEIFDDIFTQTRTGNFGFVFSSSFTINLQVKLTFGNTLIDVFRSLPSRVATLFFLPPPVRFSGNYRKKHARNALELLGTGVPIWFDRFVHSKFLLFWAFNQTRFVKHSRYYGSTNFTQGGLIKNIEEFYHNRRGWRYTINPSRNHAFYLNIAIKRIEGIINSYESPNYWARNFDEFQSKIPAIINNLTKKAAVAKDILEKLRVSMLSYSYMLDLLSNLWNFPGKQFAYNTCEKLLTIVDDYSGFNLEFLEELMTWPKETTIEFIEQWKIDLSRYLEIPSKAIKALVLLKDETKKYREKGYKAYIYREEKELMKRLKTEQMREALSILRKHMRSNDVIRYD